MPGFAHMALFHDLHKYQVSADLGLGKEQQEGNSLADLPQLARTDSGGSRAHQVDRMVLQYLPWRRKDFDCSRRRSLGDSLAEPLDQHNGDVVADSPGHSPDNPL